MNGRRHRRNQHRAGRFANLAPGRQPQALVPALLTGYLWLKGAHPGLPGLGCPLRALTGIPCPTCFLTRATATALHGQWSESLALHAFGPLAAATLLVWSALAIQRARLLPVRPPAWVLAGLTLALLGYWTARMVSEFALGIPAFPLEAIPPGAILRGVNALG